ncbi:MAG: NADAR family protein [Oscillospiraceae bacterium]|nr:NADAR family protein [Oscillospiraceae bacterium]MBR0392835.1 NADAR family protein [Oscillospiraceae bacterium]
MSAFNEKGTEKLIWGNTEVNAVFFHRTDEPNGFFSTWYPAPFELDAISYANQEQFIKYQKSLIHGDMASARAILAADSPAKQKELGRATFRYNSHVWNGMRQTVALRGLMAQYTQNTDLKEKLLGTGDAWLVACSERNRVWTCGVSLQDEARLDASLWQGENILGFSLMEVRRLLRERE